MIIQHVARLIRRRPIFLDADGHTFRRKNRGSVLTGFKKEEKYCEESNMSRKIRYLPLNVGAMHPMPIDAYL